jgi:hypothetical protein
VDDRKDHPLVEGLVALVAVGLVVGLIAGGAALAASKVLGLDSSSALGESTASQSMYLPKPQKTKANNDPSITLGPGATPSQQSPSGQPSKKPAKPKNPISLSAAQTQVSPMGEIDLSGTYPGGEGAVLRVQRLTGGSWTDFPVTTTVSNATFSTYIKTGQSGKNTFRVLDTDTGKSSNKIVVTVG